MERKKTNEIYFLSYEAMVNSGSGKATATRGVSFFWSDVVMLSESSIIRNCTVVKTTFSEFTINEQFDLVDGEWNAFLKRDKLGITQVDEHN